MRIGIDGRLYTQTGVGRYIRNLITHLGEIDTKNDYTVYLKGKEYSYFKPPNKNWHKKLVDIHWHTIQEQLIFPKILIKDNLDVTHFPYFNVPIFYPGKYLLTIHDLILDHFDTGKASTLPFIFYKFKRLGYHFVTSAAIRKAKYITTISQTTKNEVMKHYRVGASRIKVTYDALDRNFIKMADKNHAINYYKFPYLLYVGNAYPHKNLERLLEALKIIKQKKKVKLVLAGDDNYFFPRLKKYAKNLHLNNEVIFFGMADDRELFNLYSYAQCLISPSLMEGFGLPNMETLYCDRLPVVSNIPVFREIWGKNILYFDPYSIEDMAEKILYILNLTISEYREKTDRAKKILSDFSWQKTAIETLKIYKIIFGMK